MGIEIVEGRDLVAHDGNVFMRTTKGLQPRRRDLSPHQRRFPRSAASFAKIRGSACPVWSTPIATATSASRTPSAPASPTTKSIYHFVPKMIRYYLERGSDSSERADLSRVGEGGSRLTFSNTYPKLVVKAANESGGYGMLDRPAGDEGGAAKISARRVRKESAQLHRAADRSALPRALLSAKTRWKAATSICGRTFSTARRSRSFPAASRESRSAPGSLVVNSSQGGGSKDTWVWMTKRSRSDASVAARLANPLHA